MAHDRNLDEVVGVVHLRDLLDQGTRPVGEVAGELVAFPETAGVLDVLHEMQPAACSWRWWSTSTVPPPAS